MKGNNKRDVRKFGCPEIDFATVAVGRNVRLAPWRAAPCLSLHTFYRSSCAPG
jgi:hypothetical protein